jgi:predicted porin
MRSVLAATVGPRTAAHAALVVGLGLVSPLALSQVTVFGVLDTSLNRVSADGAGSRMSLSPDGNTSGRLGFRGTEDMGGGLKANFWLELAVGVDDGTSGGTSTTNKDSVSTGGVTFGRRSTVGIEGPWGEVRAGRDYVPSFGNLTTSMHPFGTNGVGSSGHLFYPVNAGGTSVRTSVRASNSIGYFLPSNAMGFYGAAMIAYGEQPSVPAATSDDGDHTGVRLGWRQGPWNMSYATGKTKYATGNYTQTNAGINYQMGPAKLMLLWGENKVGITRTRATMVGTQWDLTPTTELRAAYTTLAAKGVASDASHIALGVVHALSKRTALYGNWARIDNKGTGNQFGVGLKATAAGGNSSGFDAGIRLSF